MEGLKLQSRLISRKREIERDLKINRGMPPQRKQALIQTLIGIERDIKALGLSDEELKSNDIKYARIGEIRSQSNYMPLPSWVAQDNDKSKDPEQETSQDRVRKLRLEAEARVAGPSGKQQMKDRLASELAEVTLELAQEPSDPKRITFLRMRVKELNTDLKTLA
jgi:hypothetical protein